MDVLLAPEIFHKLVPLSICLQISLSIREDAARWYIEFVTRHFRGLEKKVLYSSGSVYTKLWKAYTKDDENKYFANCSRVGLVYRGYVQNKSHHWSHCNLDCACRIGNGHLGSKYVFSNTCSRDAFGYLVHDKLSKFEPYYYDKRLLDHDDFIAHIYDKNIHSYLYPTRDNVRTILDVEKYKQSRCVEYIIDTQSMYKMFWMSVIGDIAREFPRLGYLVNKLIITRIKRYLALTNDAQFNYEFTLDEHMRSALADVNNRILNLAPNDNLLAPTIEWLESQTYIENI